MTYFTFMLQSCIISFFILVTPQLLFAENQNNENSRGNLPENLENALTSVIDATSPKKALPSTADLNTILSFVLSNTKESKDVHPATREYGKGIFYKDMLQTSLSTFIKYILNPAIPGEVLYPTSIRRNEWMEKSEILTTSSTFINTSLPPNAPIFSRGFEYEEITPDISSGCYYNYILNRLFILYPFENKTAFFSVSFLPNQSSVGLRGAVLGNDDQWEYVYSTKEGTNLSMLSWAKTYMYGSASITIYIQESNNPYTNVYMFKWTNAGWSGMNVVTPKHITDGVVRFFSGLKQVIESPNLPLPQEIIKKDTELNAMSLQELQEALNPFGLTLATQSLKDSTLSKNIFQAILKDGHYPTTLNKKNAIAELLKLYMKKQLTQNTIIETTGNISTTQK